MRMSRAICVGWFLLLLTAVPVAHAQAGVGITLPQAIQTEHVVTITGELELELPEQTDRGSFLRQARVTTTWGVLGPDGVLPFRMTFESLAEKMETTIEGASTTPFPSEIEGIVRVQPGTAVEIELIDPAPWSQYAMVRDLVRSMIAALPPGDADSGQMWTVQDEEMAELTFPQSNIFFSTNDQYLIASKNEGRMQIVTTRKGSARLGPGPLGPRGDRFYFFVEFEASGVRDVDPATGMLLAYEADELYSEKLVSYEDGLLQPVTLVHATLRVNIRISDGRVVGQGDAVDVPQRPLQIVMGPWVTSEPPAYAAKVLLEEYFGVPVLVRVALPEDALAQVAIGAADLFFDLWSNLGDIEPFLAVYGDEVESFGRPLLRNAETGWAVPAYVPIRSVAELADYVDRFGGRIYSLNSQEIVQISNQVLRHYGLNYTIVPRTEEDLVDTVAGAIEAGEWIVFTVYRPHSMFAEHDIRFLEEPEGFWSVDDLWPIARVGFHEDYPEIAAFLTEWELSLDDYEAMLRRIQVDRLPPFLAAVEWLTAHQEEIEALVAAVRR